MIFTICTTNGIVIIMFCLTFMKTKVHMFEKINVAYGTLVNLVCHEERISMRALIDGDGEANTTLRIVPFSFYNTSQYYSQYYSQ